MTFLKALGQFFLKVLHVGENVAKAELPVISGISPAIGAAVNLGLNLAITTEQQFAAVGKQTGTGAQKVAAATTVGAQAIIQLLKSEGIEADFSHAQAFIGHLADALNALPAPAELLAAPAATPAVEIASAVGGGA